MHCASVRGERGEGRKAYCEAPVDGKEEFALKTAKLVYGDTTYTGVVGVCTERITVGLAGKRDGGDDEAMAREGGDGEGRGPGAYLVYVMHDDEEAGFLVAVSDTDE